MRRKYLPIFDEFEHIYNALNSSCCSSGHCHSISNGVSISEDDSKLYIDAQLPGVKSEEASVTFDPKNRTLSICGEAATERANVKFHVKSSKCFCYEIPLQTDVDLDAEIDAVSKDGILTVSLTKSKSNKPQKIGVRVA